MSRIAECFEALRAQGRTALVPYITAGDPEPGVTVELMHALVEGGADLIELGVPFSDPMADGPVIQAACERALQHHVGLRQVLDLVGAFRKRDARTPVVLMGYLNPLEAMGYGAFASAARAAGVDGVLIVDLPPEEGGELLRLLDEEALDPIFLLSPTSTEARIDSVCARARGYVYYVSLKGVTGADTLNVSQVAERLGLIRARCTLPVGVGFGIKDASTAAQVAQVADAVIVGSAVVRLVETHADQPQSIAEPLRALMQSMREAMDGAVQASDLLGESNR
ncbi:tryptophan synthase subunit alpha [Acidihalobacter ferrooxydans]|uniref:Tryptophan synthase alpha chain n=1 Tax=Acidihalobacter ferrooxydans TaxID=1765967 RepID=A0A1P8UGG9_9GAMM|nr:tryptophan synthase subunit alpha [Acidihalobacter ferrooxydans]APZ42947.1 tryptophan synthase subunit alpha [Acidihalobacter ferrooxydans]